MATTSGKEELDDNQLSGENADPMVESEENEHEEIGKYVVDPKVEEEDSDVEEGEGTSASGYLHHRSFGPLPVEGRGWWQSWKASSFTRSLAGKKSSLLGPKTEGYFYCKKCRNSLTSHKES